jgi:endonuclease/exonuclease/phosphatase (EEP) superfamily protein YafD
MWKISKRVRWWAVKLGALYTLLLYTLGVLRAGFSDQLWWVAFGSNFAFFAWLPLLILAPLAWWSRARRALLWMLPVFIWGMVTFGRVFIPKTSAPVTVPLTVTTLNMWVEHPSLHRIRAWLRAAPPDIVLLQEAPPFWADNVPELRDLYPYYIGQPGLPLGNAKLLLSRYPIRESEAFSLTPDDIFVQQRAVIDVRGRQIAVYNIHLYPLKGDTPRVRLSFAPDFALWNIVWSFDDRIRRAQVAALIARLDAEPLPYIVGGDFNFSDQTALYDRLAARAVDSYRAAGWGMGWTFPADGAEGIDGRVPLLLRVDYIWHSAGLRTAGAWVSPPLGSDHLAVTARMDVD